MPDEKLTPERAVRLLHAKGAELEQQVKYGDVRGKDDLHSLVADVALIAQLLADHIEQGLQERADEDEAWMIRQFVPGANDIDVPPTHKMPSRGFEQPASWGPDHPDYDEMGQ